MAIDDEGIRQLAEQSGDMYVIPSLVLQFETESRQAMTADDVKARIDAIRAHTRDYESAHSLEDTLLWDFVKFVADACDDSASTDIAPLLLDWHKESEKDPRYCA